MSQKEDIQSIGRQYAFGFTTPIENEEFPTGLSTEIVRRISGIKNEPPYMLSYRLRAFEAWQKMSRPSWAEVSYEPEDFQALRYYAAPKQRAAHQSLDELDPELLKTFERLGIPLTEQKRIAGVAVDAVFDSVSLGTTHQAELANVGVIFCSMQEAIREHPQIVQKYLGSVIPHQDNFYAALNGAVFSDGSFCYIPPGVKCPLDLSTYFRINASGTGQFERTLIVADRGSFVNYLEGCTAPQRDENQLHAAVVEIVALEDATVNYATVQNWYAGNSDGIGGVYNFVTKRGICQGARSKISWTQVEAGSAITWKYPSVILKGDDSSGEFYSVALTNQRMQADTGTKMIHLGKRTRSRIISKGISCDHSRNTYRGQVKIAASAEDARNFSQCDSMLVGPNSVANTIPYIDAENPSAQIEHEAKTSRLSEEQLFYLQTRGLTEEEAIQLLLRGFCDEVFKKLPLEFSVEAVKLLEMKLEESVG